MKNDDQSQQPAKAEVEKPKDVAPEELSEAALDKVSGGLIWRRGQPLPEPRKEKPGLLEPL